MAISVRLESSRSMTAGVESAAAWVTEQEIRRPANEGRGTFTSFAASTTRLCVPGVLCGEYRCGGVDRCCIRCVRAGCDHAACNRAGARYDRHDDDRGTERAA